MKKYLVILALAAASAYAQSPEIERKAAELVKIDQAQREARSRAAQPPQAPVSSQGGSPGWTLLAFAALAGVAAYLLYAKTK